jgi:hypothetical protein
MGDIFLITSVINTGNHPWTYTSTRSIYTPQERYTQTLDTISSIQKYAPNSKIIHVECSDLPPDMEKMLSERVEYYINTYSDEKIRLGCLSNGKKGFGELLKTQVAIEYLDNNNIQFDRLFKISGRYYLTDRFNQSNFSYDKFTFLQGAQNVWSTRLYCVPNNLKDTFRGGLYLAYNNYMKHYALTYETALPSECNPKHLVEVLGVGGLIAVDNSIIDE